MATANRTSVPTAKETVAQVDWPPEAVRTYDEALAGGLSFEDGAGPALVHGFTPREHVRRFVLAVTAAHGCPYVVHLEDNEALVLDNDLAAEIITGAGPGGGPHVKVFRQDGSMPFGTGFFAYDPNFHGGVEVAVSTGAP